VSSTSQPQISIVASSTDILRGFLFGYVSKGNGTCTSRLSLGSISLAMMAILAVERKASQRCYGVSYFLLFLTRDTFYKTIKASVLFYYVTVEAFSRNLLSFTQQVTRGKHIIGSLM